MTCVIKNTPGQPCCIVPCGLDEWDFTGSGYLSDFTQESGTWTEETGYLTTASANAVLRPNAESNNDTAWVQVKASGDEGDEVRMRFVWDVDDDTYYEVRATFGQHNGSLSIWQSDGSTVECIAGPIPDPNLYEGVQAFITAVATADKVSVGTNSSPVLGLALLESQGLVPLTSGRSMAIGTGDTAENVRFYELTFANETGGENGSCYGHMPCGGVWLAYYGLAHIEENYEQVAGVWSETASLYMETDSATGLILFDHELRTVANGVSYSLNYLGPFGAGDTIRLIFDYRDADNYRYLEHVYGGTDYPMNVYEVVGGAAPSRISYGGSLTNFNGANGVTFYRFPEYAAWVATTGGSGRVPCDYSYGIDEPTRIGFQVVSRGTADKPSFRVNNYVCQADDVGCSDCSGVQPFAVDIVIGGASGDCAAANGTHRLRQDWRNLCRWITESPASPISSMQLVVSAEMLQFTCLFLSNGPRTIDAREVPPEGGFDCATWDATPINDDLSVGSCTTNTVTVTAV